MMEFLRSSAFFLSMDLQEHQFDLASCFVPYFLLRRSSISSMAKVPQLPSLVDQLVSVTRPLPATGDTVFPPPNIPCGRVPYVVAPRGFEQMVGPGVRDGRARLVALSRETEMSKGS